MSYYEITGDNGKTYKSYTKTNAVAVAKIYRAVKVIKITELKIN